MQNIERRIENIEQKIRSNSEVEHVIVDIVYFGDDKAVLSLPKDKTKWLTYQEQLKNPPTQGKRYIFLSPKQEAEARAKATECHEKKQKREN